MTSEDKKITQVQKLNKVEEKNELAKPVANMVEAINDIADRIASTFSDSDNEVEFLDNCVEMFSALPKQCEVLHGRAVRLKELVAKADSELVIE